MGGGGGLAWPLPVVLCVAEGSDLGHLCWIQDVSPAGIVLPRPCSCCVWRLMIKAQSFGS